MVKKKLIHYTRVKKRKLHPILVIIASFFTVIFVTVVFVGNAYKNEDPIQKVAGAENISSTTPSSVKKSDAFIYSASLCLVVKSILGRNTNCARNTYSEVIATCGDGKIISLSSSTRYCASLTGWVTKIASACSNHALCSQPTPGITPHETSQETTHPTPITATPQTSTNR